MRYLLLTILLLVGCSQDRKDIVYSMAESLCSKEHSTVLEIREVGDGKWKVICKNESHF